MTKHPDQFSKDLIKEDQKYSKDNLVASANLHASGTSGESQSTSFVENTK
jgi:hypothetical protein